jgi:outer membrane protein TolC
MSKLSFTVPVLLSILARATPVFAQTPPRSISEQDVVTAAVVKNPTLHVALLQVQQSDYDLRAESARYTGVLGASAGYTHGRTPTLAGTTGVLVSQSDVTSLSAGLTQPLSYGTTLSATVSGQSSYRSIVTPGIVTGSSGVTGTGSGPGYLLTGQLALTQPLLRGAGQDIGLAGLRQAKLARTANQLAAQQAASGLLSQVVGAYWELWYSNEVVRIDQASLELARTIEQQARQQVQTGALAPASALPYITNVAQLDEAVLAAQLDVHERELALAQLLGEPRGLGESLRATDDPRQPIVDELSQDSATSDALRTSYQRKQLQTQLAILKDQLKIAGDPLRPRLDLDAYVQAQGLGNRSVPPAFEQFGRLDAVSAHVGLTFELPLTDTRRSAQIQSALFACHVAEQQIAENELEIRGAVAKAMADLSAARQRLELASKTEKVAGEQAEAEQQRFAAGGSIAVTVQQAEDSHRQAQLRVQRARVDLVLADITLAQLRGQLLTRYADALQHLPAGQRATLSDEPPGNF